MSWRDAYNKNGRIDEGKDSHGAEYPKRGDFREREDKYWCLRRGMKKKGSKLSGG